MLSRIPVLSSLATFALASTLVAPASHAATITYTTPTGSTSQGQPVSASATFTTSSGQIQITLTNTLSPSQMVSVSQALSDLSFTLSNTAGTFTGGTAVGQEGNIANNVVSYTTGSPDRFLGIGGGTFSVNGSTVLLEAIGGGTPSEMILPFLANGGAYTNANGGLDNGNFNPYTIGPATFTLNLSGVTANTTVTSASFSFGTGPDTVVGGGGGSPVPEPSSLVLLGTGIIGAAGALRRRFAN